jgi:hypothetical protein
MDYDKIKPTSALPLLSNQGANLARYSAEFIKPLTMFL